MSPRTLSPSPCVGVLADFRDDRPVQAVGRNGQALSPEWMPASSMCSITPPDHPLAVGDRVDVDLDGVFQELVDQHRLVPGMTSKASSM